MTLIKFLVLMRGAFTPPPTILVPVVYGLIIPSKTNKAALLTQSVPETKKTVFANESDSDDSLEDEDGSLDWRSRTAAKAVERSMQRNQARQAALKALEEDPTVFQYDEIYDSIEQQKDQEKPKQKVEKKPKYIANLLRCAEQRKVENERRVERKVQKEREAEGDTFKDKEAFVTPAYRAKLAELKKAEEEEKRKEQMEAILDVRKQQDMSGFYRHLYKQKFAEEEKEAEPEEETQKTEDKPTSHPKGEKKQRQYRRQREESVSPPRAASPEILKSREQEKESDSDDFAEDSAKEKSQKREPLKRVEASAALVAARNKEEAEVAETRNVKVKIENTSEKASKRPAADEPSSDEDRKPKSRKRSPRKSPEPADKENEEIVKETKPKVDIWKKRTVAELYESALEKYLARKEMRESGTIPWPTQ
nr:EOG090X0D2W [Eulimnadia texana]